MKVKFIKDHVSGFREGAVVDLKDTHAKTLMDKGFVVFVEETEDPGSSNVQVEGDTKGKPNKKNQKKIKS